MELEGSLPCSQESTISSYRVQQQQQRSNTCIITDKKIVTRVRFDPLLAELEHSGLRFFFFFFSSSFYCCCYCWSRSRAI